MKARQKRGSMWRQQKSNNSERHGENSARNGMGGGCNES